MKINFNANFAYVAIAFFFAVIMNLTFKLDYFETFMFFGMTGLLLNIKRENGEK